MRTERVAAFFAAAALLLAPKLAAQQALTLELTSPGELHVGDRTSLLLRVTPAGDEPLLVTPTSSGQALSVARGRLFARDGRREGDTLVLPVPIIAERPGHGSVRVGVEILRCDETCAWEHAETEIELLVLR